MLSFTRIAKEVLNDGRHDIVNLDSEIKRLNRKFTKLIEASGINARILKDDRSRMYFDENDAPILKKILRQLDEERGFADALIRKHQPESMELRNFREFKTLLHAARISLHESVQRDA